MNNPPYNFGKSELCELLCHKLINNEHLMTCSYLNKERNNTVCLEQLRNGNITQKIEFFEILQQNTRKRNKLLNLKY